MVIFVGAAGIVGIVLVIILLVVAVVTGRVVWISGSVTTKLEPLGFSSPGQLRVAS